MFDDRAIFFVPDKLKTTRPGHHLPPLELTLPPLGPTKMLNCVLRLT